jgi:hypothetical protein
MFHLDNVSVDPYAKQISVKSIFQDTSYLCQNLSVNIRTKERIISSSAIIACTDRALTATMNEVDFVRGTCPHVPDNG